MKYKDRDLTSLDALRRGTLATRLMVFYDMFGARSENWFHVWDDEEVAKIVGWRRPDGRLNTASVREVRARLIAEGELEDVRHQMKGRTFWSFRPAKCGLMDDEALAALSAKMSGTVFCRAEDRALFELRHRIRDLPVIYMWGYSNNVRPWHDLLVGLIDFGDTQALDFWTGKAFNAVNGKDHPLRKIEDHALRLQVALSGLERGIKRNLDNNPEWCPEDHVGWALNALTRVGEEKDWMPLYPAEDAAKERAAQATSKRPWKTIVDEAKAHLARLEKKAGLTPGGPDPRVQAAVDDAKAREAVAHRRRPKHLVPEELVGATGIVQFGFGQPVSPAGVGRPADHDGNADDGAAKATAESEPGYEWDTFVGREPSVTGVAEDVGSLLAFLDGDETADENGDQSSRRDRRTA